MNRSLQCWRHCAAPRTLLSNSPAVEIFAGLFFVGAALFALGTWLTRRTQQQPETSPGPITWTQQIAGPEPLPWELRLDIIERLAIVAQPWCVDLLNQALKEETDPVVRDAAERALLVIGAR